MCTRSLNRSCCLQPWCIHRELAAEIFLPVDESLSAILRASCARVQLQDHPASFCILLRNLPRLSKAIPPYSTGEACKQRLLNVNHGSSKNLHSQSDDPGECSGRSQVALTFISSKMHPATANRESGANPCGLSFSLHRTLSPSSLPRQSAENKPLQGSCRRLKYEKQCEQQHPQRIWPHCCVGSPTATRSSAEEFEDKQAVDV